LGDIPTGIPIRQYIWDAITSELMPIRLGSTITNYLSFLFFFLLFAAGFITPVNKDYHKDIL